MKVGAAGFVVPFMFVYEPALLMIGDWPTIIWRFILSCVGIGMLAAGLHGYLLRAMPYWERGVAIAAALLLVAPELTTDMIGLGPDGGLVAFQYMGAARRQAGDRRRCSRRSPHRARTHDEEKDSRRSPQPSLVRGAGSALVRASLAPAPDRL